MVVLNVKVVVLNIRVFEYLLMVIIEFLPTIATLQIIHYQPFQMYG